MPSCRLRGRRLPAPDLLKRIFGLLEPSFRPGQPGMLAVADPSRVGG
jgi:hypothetical protein